MAGRAGRWTGERWSDLIYLPCTEANGFVPDFPAAVPDIIYLCYPNNPTGTVLHRDALAAWVDYARRHGALIIYDAAYEAFIKDADSDVPHTSPLSRTTRCRTASSRSPAPKRWPWNAAPSPRPRDSPACAVLSPPSRPR